MHYVTCEGLTKSFGIQPLFKNITFHIEEGDKIALIARNGVGKSTLLRLLADRDKPDAGKLWIHKDVTIALFEQEPNFDENSTVLENIFFSDNAVLKAIAAYEASLETEDGDAISDAIVAMDDMNAWDFESKVKQIMGKLNIHRVNVPVSTLSGGQRKRVALARTLIEIGFEHKHTLLMMDEPTNHLDVNMIEWLTHYLNQEHVTLLLVSHDRYFLEDVCDEIWELDSESMFTYKGDYANYLEKKAARLESDLASIDKAQNQYRKELEWMRKQPKARTVKSKSRIDNFYEVETKAKQKIEDAQLQLQMKMSRLGGKVVEMKKVYKAYDDLQIMRGFDYNFSKGDRIGIIGKNGVGKSTFLNMLQGLEQADSGKINIGDTVIFGYYNQQGLEIKEDKRVIEYVKDIAEHFPLADGSSLSAAQFLNLFLFPPDKQFTFISKLSGGEKKRLMLLTILFRNPNFLILDEPTNDIDLPTLGVLENFLQSYPGCVLIVTHDRYFMDKLVDHLFVFEGDGVIRDFPGNYTLYREYEKAMEGKPSMVDGRQSMDNTLEADGKKTSMEGKPSMVDSRQSIGNTIEADAKPAVLKRKASFKEKHAFENLTKEIAALEKEKVEVTVKLNSGEKDFAKLQALSNRIGEITSLLEMKELEWLELSEIVQ
jgi:ABC transport system ATP-binding/permease protein